MYSSKCKGISCVFPCFLFACCLRCICSVFYTLTCTYMYMYVTLLRQLSWLNSKSLIQIQRRQSNAKQSNLINILNHIFSLNWGHLPFAVHITYTNNLHVHVHVLIVAEYIHCIYMHYFPFSNPFVYIYTCTRICTDV